MITRGNRRCPIFVDDVDRNRFFSLLEEATRRYRVYCTAYCLMGNHYHLALETRDGLSAAMHYLNGRYAREFNLRHGFTGHLFERRFISVRVETDWQLLELGRYIVLNPIRAGLCAEPAEWRWSSYRPILGLSAAPPFLDTPRFLELFDRDRHRARRAFHDFVASAPERVRFGGRKSHPPVPGTGELAQSERAPAQPRLTEAVSAGEALGQ